MRWCRSVFILIVSNLMMFFSASLYGQSLRWLTPDKISGDSLTSLIGMKRDSIVAKHQYAMIRTLDIYLDHLPAYRFKDPLGIRKAFCYQAYAYEKKLGDYKSAEKYYSLAMQHIGRDKYNDSWVCYVEQPLANIYTRSGDYDKAIALLQFVIKATEIQGDKKGTAGAYSDLGIVYSEMNQLPQSIIAYENGEKYSLLAESIEDYLLNKLNKVDLLIQMKKGNEVEKELNIIKINLNKLTKRRGEYELEYFKLLAIRLSDAGEHTEAIRILNQCKSLLDNLYKSKINREYAKFYYLAAREYLSVGDKKNAFSNILSGLKSLNPAYSRSNILTRKLLYADNTFDQLYSCLGDYYQQIANQTARQEILDSSIQAYDRALSARKLLYNSYIYDDSKLMNLARSRSITNSIIDLLYKKDQVTQNKTEDSQIKYYFEISGGRMLTESIARKKKFEQLTLTQKGKLKNNQVKIDSLKNKNTVESNLEIAQLRDEQEKILDQISGQSYFTNYSGKFIHYVSTGNSVFSLDNFGSQLQFKYLCPAREMDSLVNHFLSLILQPGSYYQNTAKEIYNILFGKDRDIPERFAILTSDQLSRVPFGALIDKKGSFLISHHIIEYRSNFLCPNAVKQSSGIYAVAPDYSSSSLSGNVNRRHLFPLLFTGEEVKALCTQFQEVIVEKKVTKAKLKNILENGQIMHYAGHAESGSDMGRLFISGDENNAVYGNEIANWYSSLNLAVLSACETGAGEIFVGEGKMSLARSFLESGTHNVIYSLWSVNDQSTARLMKSFYKHFADSRDVATALRDAKLEYLQTAGTEARHPYYWAGFVLMTNSPEKETSYLFWVGILTLICILSIFCLIIYKKLHK